MRRPQFTLKAMLGMAAAVCLVLGGRHLLKTYGQYVVAGPANYREPIIVEGRTIQFFGPRELKYHFVLSSDTAPGGGIHAPSYLAKSSWVCAYDYRAVIPGLREFLPGEYQLDVRSDTMTKS